MTGKGSNVARNFDDLHAVASGVQNDSLSTGIAFRFDRPNRDTSRFEHRDRVFDIRHGHRYDAVASAISVAQDVKPARAGDLPHHFFVVRYDIWSPAEKEFVPGTGRLEVCDRDSREEDVHIHFVILPRCAIAAA
jgi:hypothetical protein